MADVSSRSPKLLGLEFIENHWVLENKQQQWQVGQSEFIDDGETHQLLVFTNIESVLRAGQQTAWQQLIRVMGHEIRNSLTPVSSLAESLIERTEKNRDKQALALISERCDHLQDFISRYSSLSQRVALDTSKVCVKALSHRMRVLFENKPLNIAADTNHLWADITFLEQVLINLVKNALEANASLVTLNFSQSHQQSIITVVDDGHGFANIDNLFVPLFTTKADGQGIGLSFCRNIIEQHNGSITLVNNNTSGVTVTIKLPLKND